MRDDFGSKIDPNHSINKERESILQLT